MTSYSRNPCPTIWGLVTSSPSTALRVSWMRTGSPTRTPKGPKLRRGSYLSLIRDIEVFDEPALEFGVQISHIDIRFGIMNYGPLDVGSESAPNRSRVRTVG